MRVEKADPKEHDRITEDEEDKADESTGYNRNAGASDSAKTAADTAEAPAAGTTGVATQ